MSYDYISSLPAYKENPKGKDFCRQQVLIAVKKLQPCNDRQIAEYLKWPINRVTPRRGELEKANLVVCAGKRKDEQTNRLVSSP